jgi:hypothetical protein
MPRLLQKVRATVLSSIETLENVELLFGMFAADLPRKFYGFTHRGSARICTCVYSSVVG